MRIGVGGGNRVLRGGVSVGKGGVRGGGGVGPFFASGGGGSGGGAGGGGAFVAAVLLALAAIYYIFVAMFYLLLALAPIAAVALAARSTFVGLTRDPGRRTAWLVPMAISGCVAALVVIYWAVTGNAWYGAVVAGGVLLGGAGVVAGYAFDHITHRPQVARVAHAAIASGDRVRHADWGEGVVREVIGVGDSAEAVVVFNGKGAKRLLLGWTALEKL